MIELLINTNVLCSFNSNTPLFEIKKQIEDQLNIPSADYYLISNGKLATEDNLCERLHFVLKLRGGKGGFGSMLRAIGAQIEKTTNREACRDLSGRRLRDINEEQRLKNWIATQAEREKEAAERKKKKLEKLCEKPKHEFKDEQYDQERSLLPEIVEDAVAQGLKASCSKRKNVEENGSKKKRKKLWIDAELSSSEEDSASENEEIKTEATEKSPT